MNIGEIVERYIECHKLSSCGACDGACDECEFVVDDDDSEALQNLHCYAVSVDGVDDQILYIG